ncbi:MAG: hypothetical protein OSB05_03305 [Akkermansiaceae bacterium]|nr:hypothetical protein [Akkermansiaceae bacterium]
MRSAQYSLPDSYHSGYVKVQTQTNQSDIAIRTHVLANLANIDVSNDTLCAQLSIGDVGMKLTGKSMNRLGGAPPKELYDSGQLLDGSPSLEWKGKQSTLTPDRQWVPRQAGKTPLRGSRTRTGGREVSLHQIPFKFHLVAIAATTFEVDLTDPLLITEKFNLLTKFFPNFSPMTYRPDIHLVKSAV